MDLEIATHRRPGRAHVTPGCPHAPPPPRSGAGCLGPSGRPWLAREGLLDDPLLVRLGLAILMARATRPRGEAARLRTRPPQLRERRAQGAGTPLAESAREGPGARRRRRDALRVERDRRVPRGALPRATAPPPRARRAGDGAH